ncbi:MAG: glutamine-hydrolyzing carbamoyl-phosphate synthase small subunit [Planctomycetota bacterium]|jgi:carbamoyl-phosphate synthase small subunit
MTQTPCILALEDGTIYHGQSFGATGTQVGEVVFNTSMTGYQEILTDPSYRGQMVIMTYPLIGNYGINQDDEESAQPHASGLVIRELSPSHNNYRSTGHLSDYLARHGVVGIQGVDTRGLTRRIRLEGAMRGALSTTEDPAECVRLAREAPTMIGADLVAEVAPRETYSFSESFLPGLEPPTRREAEQKTLRVIAIDCGVKRNILRHLVSAGFAVEAVPPTASPESILESAPDGIFVSNGPGDPAAVHYATDLLRQLIGKAPIFGICLGHQLIGRALGAETFKLKFGHRGGNQPVKNLLSEYVEITSQNHGFAIDMPTLESAGCTATHINLNDNTLEGFVHRDEQILAVQYHPEASPGPHDAGYLFDAFRHMIESNRPLSAETFTRLQARVPHRNPGVGAGSALR